MKKIYWCIQQLDRIGGTEQVSVDLMNHLCDSYDVTLVCTSQTVGPIVYDLDERIKVINLNIPSELGRFDQYSTAYLKSFHFIKFFKLIHQLLKFYIFRRKNISSRLESLIKGSDSVLICSSLDSYWFAPDKGHVYFHFHFNAKAFFSFGNRIALSFCHKPEKYIFLSKSTLDIVKKRNAKIGSKALYIYNPIRFEPSLNLTYQDNTLIFAGRFSKQKNPLLALQIALKLKEDGINFKLKMFGQGNLENKMKKYIRKHQLENFVFINKPTKNLKSEILSSDLLLITSLFEGFVLVKGEAAALSRPVISSNWGDTVSEMIRPGEDGFIIDSFKPEDYAFNIEEIFSHPEELKKLKEGAYESAFNLSFDKIIPLWKELLK